MDFLTIVFNIVAALVGFPAVLAALINLAKWLGWVPDGSAPVVNEVAHLIVYATVGVLVLLGKVDLIPGIDVKLSALASVLVAVLAFLTSIKVTKIYHEYVLQGLPLVGFTHSEE